MVGELQHYADAPFVYDFCQGPERVPNEDVAREEGLNCVSLAHLAVESLFRRRLPAQLHCYEMFTDHERFHDLDDSEPLQVGDLVWFGRSEPSVPPEQFVPTYDANGYLLNWQDSPVNHVAIYTGDQENDDPLLLHATYFTGTTAVWPLSKFAEYPRYAQVRRIARLRPDPAGQN